MWPTACLAAGACGSIRTIGRADGASLRQRGVRARDMVNFRGSFLLVGVKNPVPTWHHPVQSRRRETEVGNRHGSPRRVALEHALRDAFDLSVGGSWNPEISHKVRN
jgi:hypothetical protein